MPLLLATHTQNAEIFSLKKVDANGSTSSSFLLLNTAAAHREFRVRFHLHNDFRKLPISATTLAKSIIATTITSTTLRFSSRRRRRQKSSSKVVVKSRFSRRARAKGGGGRNGRRRRRRRSVFFIMSLLCVFFSRGKAPSFFLLHCKDDFDALCTPPPRSAQPRETATTTRSSGRRKDHLRIVSRVRLNTNVLVRGGRRCISCGVEGTPTPISVG